MVNEGSDSFRLIRANQAAEMLGIGISRLRQLCSERGIPYVKLGRSVRFDPQRLQQWVAEKCVEPNSKQG